MSNGRSSNPDAAPVQNFFADKDHKAFNLAAFVRPQVIPGLQMGGSYYRDVFVPAGIPHVNQTIGSLYVVYNNSSWEFLNEVVLLHNHLDVLARDFNTPMGYTQVARKLGSYHPYFRYQFLNSPSTDPLNIYTGRLHGPSVGLRMDFTEFAALKVQYNRIYQRNLDPGNGLDMQVAFTF